MPLPTFATSGFEKFFGLGRALRCVLPLGLGRFMHLVVLYSYHGPDTDAECLRLTDQLFEAALGELAVVARGQPCLIVGVFLILIPGRYLVWPRVSLLGFVWTWRLLGLLHLGGNLR